MSEKRKILVVATSRKTRGGITAVVKSHEKGEQWGNYQIRWIETHIDRSFPLKLFYFFRALMQYFFLLPFYDLVHIHVATTVSLYRKVLFFVGAKIWRKKIIMHLHSCVQDVLWFKSNRSLYRYLFSHSDCVLVLSSQWKQWVYEALQVKDNVKILYNPVVVDVDEHFLSKIEKKKLVRKSAYNAIPALLMPIIILYGIYGGIFSPSEAAAVAVAYAIPVGFCIYKGLSLEKFIETSVSVTVASPTKTSSSPVTYALMR